MKAYKYLERAYALSLVSDGQIKIGTLHDWQSTEKYGPQVGDDSEATITKQQKGPLTLTSVPDFMKDASVKITFEPGASLTIMENLNLKIPCENLFGYAVSEEFSLDMLEKLRQDSKVNFDSCVEISDLDTFYRLLDRAMRKSAQLLGWNNCDYTGRTIKHDASMPPLLPWLKNAKYFYQKEIRGLWRALPGVDVHPAIIFVPQARELCKIIHPTD